MGITEAIARYISKNHLSISRIGQDLEIDFIKLQPGTKEVLTGEELLKLCQYLRIRPEEILKKYEP